MIYVIDGPAGSGKSSTAKKLADDLDLLYIDSGALYRALTLEYVRKDSNLKVFFNSLNLLSLDFNPSQSPPAVFLNGENVSLLIRTPQIDRNVSLISSIGLVREKVNTFLRGFVKSGRFISDGRDLGTVVFPDADLKIFLTASPEVRAKRRFEEQQEESYEQILEDLISRDAQDSSRQIAPLRKADDAVVIDSTSLSFHDQAEKIKSLILQANKNL